jgi:hypothetical protein
VAFSSPNIQISLICLISTSIAITPKSVIDKNGAYFDTRRKSMTPDFGVWVEGMQDSEKGTFLAH